VKKVLVLQKVRFGIVGLATMGRLHADRIAEERKGDFCLAAVADTVERTARQVGEQHDVPYFSNAQEMFHSGLIDAVIIATPHYWHPVLTVQAARAGIHVLCEKPLAATVGAARAMIDECARRKVVLGAMLQMRTRAIMKKMKEMIDAGRLGEPFRISMICSNWFRTQAYYDSGAWRGTWDGEGGGILLNQAPHSLDLFQWIGGMPTRITAVLKTRVHNIEVENSANIICEYGDAKVGYIYATTAEMPGMEQFMVCGDKGTIIVEGGQLRFGELSVPISRYVRECKIAWADGISLPKCRWRCVKLPKAPGGQHIEVIRRFAAHLLRGQPMIATGAESINELEISNAAYLSGFSGRPVNLPVDAAKMDRLLAKLERERSTGKGGGQRKRAQRQLKKLLAEKP